MNEGNCIFFTIMGMFLARACGVDMPMSSLPSFAVTVILLSMATPGVAGSGIIMLATVLKSINVPVESIGLIMGIWWMRKYTANKKCLFCEQGDDKMINSKRDDYIRKDLDKYQGILVPVEASLLERKMVRTVEPEKLHPNPDDEFCDPSIGPNYEIISKYMKMIVQYQTLKPNPWDDSVMVQKVHPDGYMILNGHHRWAAALQTNFKKVPISIVNLTRESDIRQMIESAESDKRAALDLDEIVFCGSRDIPSETPLPRKLFCLPSENYKEKIRLGVPALFHYLKKTGYDIWVYTSEYYSYDYIQSYFKGYSLNLTGVVTGTGRKYKGKAEEKTRTDKLMAAQYKETLHIDENMVLLTRRDSRDFEEHTIEADPYGWSKEVMQIVKGLRS